MMNEFDGQFDRSTEGPLFDSSDGKWSKVIARPQSKGVRAEIFDGTSYLYELFKFRLKKFRPDLTSSVSKTCSNFLGNFDGSSIPS